MDVRLVVVSQSKPRKSYAVRLPIVVGRGEEAKLRIPQDSVSRQHCRFSIEDGVVCVTDLGSTNGTLVSGTKIDPQRATPVSSGTEVRIGGVVLRIEYAASAAPPPREGDTVPLAVPDAEPAPEPIAAGSGVRALTESASAEPEAPAPADTAAAGSFPEAVEPPAALEALALPEDDPAPAEADFAAVVGAETAAPPTEGSFDFLGAEAAPPPAEDDNLEDFFKSLS